MQYTNVTDGQTDGRTPDDSKDRFLTHSVARLNDDNEEQECQKTARYLASCLSPA